MRLPRGSDVTAQTILGQTSSVGARSGEVGPPGATVPALRALT